jgi:hypothetical protein
MSSLYVAAGAVAVQRARQRMPIAGGSFADSRAQPAPSASARTRNRPRRGVASRLQSRPAVRHEILALTLVAAGCGGAPLVPRAHDTVDGGDIATADLATLAPSDAMTTTTAPDDLALAHHAHDLAHPAPHDLAPPTPSKKVLPFSWEGEQYGYYCGPSATRMALSSRMADPPSQSELGSYMGTTTNGTDDISLVRGAMNHYLSVSSYQVTYMPDDPPTAAQQADLKKSLVGSIDAGYALVVNVVSGWRPPGYPSGTIYHYVAVVGYDSDGDKVLIADPAATGCGDGLCGNPSSGFYNVPKSYWIATSDLGVWITPKGYTFQQ